MAMMLDAELVIEVPLGLARRQPRASNVKMLADLGTCLHRYPQRDASVHCGSARVGRPTTYFVFRPGVPIYDQGLRSGHAKI